MTALLDATDSQMAMLADLVAGLEAAEKTLSSMQAARDGLLAMAGRLAVEIAREAGDPDGGDMAIRSVAAEIGAAQRVSDRTVERRMSDASWLVERFPTVWAAQGEGRISAAHSRLIVDAGAHLDDEADRERFATEAIALAESESPNRLRRLVRRLAERFQERTITERHRTARRQRRVWITELDDGMADLRMRGPAALVHGMYDRLSQMAHAVQKENAQQAKAAAHEADAEAAPAAHDERTIDQLRADLLADLVLTGSPSGHDTADGLLGAIQARVEITVPAFGLMTDDGAAGTETPAELDGVAPMDAETARRFAGAASGWNRLLTHPISGAVLAVDRYRPSEELRRHLRANAAASPGVGSQRGSATSITTTMRRPAARPSTRICPRSVAGTTCSSTTPPGTSRSGRAECWSGRVRPVGYTSTIRRPRTRSSSLIPSPLRSERRRRPPPSRCRCPMPDAR